MSQMVCFGEPALLQVLWDEINSAKWASYGTQAGSNTI
jgi:hypothetical protein